MIARCNIVFLFETTNQLAALEKKKTPVPTMAGSNQPDLKIRDTPSVDPMPWETATLALPPAYVYTATTGSFQTQLSWSNTPLTNFDVLVPLTLGIKYGKDLTLKPGDPATTMGTVALSVAQEPTLQILFQSVVAGVTPSTGIAPSSSTAPGASITSTPSQPSASVPTSETAASTSAVTSGSQPKTTDGGLSTGATAGIAIGCLAAGALLAGLILWFCWRRRGSKTQYSDTNTYALASNEKGFSANAIPLTGEPSSAYTSGGGLPQPLEDKAISSDVSKISNAIKNHVQSYYHTSHVSPGLIDYDDLQALGSSLPISVGTLTTLMGNAATREIALRFIIAWVVVSKIQPSKDPSKSLLPSEVAQCYQAITTGDRGYQGMW